jgi:hypothetical protein
MRKYLLALLAAGLFTWLLPAAVFADPVVSIDPAYAQRKLRPESGDHHKIRMRITLSGAQNLLSFGVKLVYDGTEFTVLEHHKNDTDWNAGIGSVKTGTDTIVFTGGSTTPITGDDILLGWVVFQFKGCPDDMPKNVPVTVELAKDQALPPFYDNFVNTSGTVVDGDVTFNNAEVCLVAPEVDACEGDFDGNGNVSALDVYDFRAAYGAVFPSATYNPACDFDADGQVLLNDSKVFRSDSGRTDCPVCP